MTHFHQDTPWSCDAVDERLKSFEKKYAELMVENQRLLDGFLESKVIALNKKLEVVARAAVVEVRIHNVSGGPPCPCSLCYAVRDFNAIEEAKP